MRIKLTLLAGVCSVAIALPAFAQENAAERPENNNEIIVTAQRADQRLQDVPIAVSAFSAEAIERQQIKNTSDLQLTLPNITFTKTNFQSSSFTIRGIGDLCVGATCDSATAIHLNDAPLFGTRLFEGEFYDLAQIEVLRGPQGTLFGRNATAGVVNFRTARPDLSRAAAAGEVEYGNYNAVKLKGMINAPLGDGIGVRLAGFYLNRDGFTKNTYDNTRMDGRDTYGLRGSIRLEPGSNTKINLMVQYFHEHDDRLRIQKQMCQRDPTGVLGCLAGRRDYAMTNANSTFGSLLTSKELFALKGLPTSLALGSIYGADIFAGAVNPADVRTVNTDYHPKYYAQEWNLQGSVEQYLGSGLDLKVGGQWSKMDVDSSQDYNLSVVNRAVYAPGLNTLAAFAAGAAAPTIPASVLAPVANVLIPNGPSGQLCTSLPDASGTGVFGGHALCAQTPQDFDRSYQHQKSWSVETIISSKWDGKFNFLLGSIYGKMQITDAGYNIDGFSADYFAGVAGALSSRGLGYLGTPIYRGNTADMTLKTFGVFGEAYYEFNDQLKLTAGLRYNHDQKELTARTTLASFLVPFGSASAWSTPYGAGYDADPATLCPLNNPVTGAQNPAAPGAIGSVAGCDAWQVRKVKFGEWTGRAVLDYQITPNNLLYASYSRGYKSGGINPPLSPVFAVPETFTPEFVNAFEIGSKNTFGKLQLNLTGFYYSYKDLQLSRIVARTSVNDNVNAHIWGLEAEAVFRPIRELTINVNASYLNTKVAQDKYLANPRDFGGGRSDAVIIKDITNGANCAVAPNVAGNAAGANGFVNQVNTYINTINAAGNPLTSANTGGLRPGAGLQPTTAFPADGGIASRGAFSVCSILNSMANSAVGTAFGGVTVYSSGIPVNIKGNKLPGAPDYKFSAGIQYAAPLGDDMELTPRVDFIYTGKSFGNIFNGAVNAIPGYTQVNAQLQFDGPDRKWFARAWVQNLFDKNAITGLYLTDQSSGNYTNIFTLEPRRYGVTAGFKF